MENAFIETLLDISLGIISQTEVRVDTFGITATERFRYYYREEELEEWLPRIETLGDGADTVHALMNNCYSDYGIRSARALGDMLGVF